MPRVIKKYANRRLYDTQASRHLTLDGLRRLLVDGEDIQVVDDTTGADITRSVLLQVIAEQEQGGRPILSATMLKQVIRFYGHPMQDFMGQFLEQSVEAFLQQQQTLQAQLKSAFASTPLATMRQVASKNLQLWTSWQEALLEGLQPGRKKPGGDDTPSGSSE